MIVSLDEAQQHLRVDWNDEDKLLEEKIAAAEGYLDRMLGYVVAETYGGDDQPPVPPALKEAVLQLVATWFDGSRGLVMDGALADMPVSFQEIVREYREWSF